MSATAGMQAATAIRMGLARQTGVAPVVTLTAGDGPAGLSLPDGLSPEQIAERVAQAAADGVLPATVRIGTQAAFRVAPARPGADGSRLSGRVAIVTGSAQGFGRGIAEGLARQGACVVVADLNEKLGEAFAAELNAGDGAPVAVFCKTDVTKSASLAACLELAVATFGGVDVYVSNAGVLKAGGVEELDEAAFDLVTAVNYKAYFLGVKAVAPQMKLQHRLHPDWMMDVVQINSKSGLEGSNRNFAYAGSKFGGIGLTQSFALELIGDGIKVNSICPGNYFEGPLWSDPERGLFVQYLRAGKVPGAKTIADVKAFYMAKVPMRRGCLPEDVVTAILYLHDQQYETGQALPVTGGQVMLN